MGEESYGIARKRPAPIWTLVHSYRESVKQPLRSQICPLSRHVALRLKGTEASQSWDTNRVFTGLLCPDTYRYESVPGQRKAFGPEPDLWASSQRSIAGNERTEFDLRVASSRSAHEVIRCQAGQV